MALLSANHITVAPLAPATESGATFTFTFPITGGRFNTTTLRGFIRHSGGLSLSNGRARIPSLDQARSVLDALGNGTATGTVNITAFTAHAVNRLAGKHVAGARRRRRPRHRHQHPEHRLAVPSRRHSPCSRRVI